ncbi:NAD(P)/FAD-dependent oxidoreductase [Ramlibacter alkalitolerans]|uniref:NAD(P)/FAD-dependent oxidoreductase n=1 Tax=Ramlibacter alkalitolerans TaxID=2039631 RepID=UPI002ED1159A
MIYDLVVVGASFAGLACARAAALGGSRVLVIDKKPGAGARLHTTGMIVKDAVDTIPWLRDVPSELVRRIEGVRLYAPNLRHVDLHAPGYYFWATDVPRLMQWMVGIVQAAGAEVRYGALFTSVRREREHDPWSVVLGTGETVLCHYIVGADGPHSRVAKALGLSQNRQFLFGVEHEYAQADLEPNYLHCFLDSQLAPGYIGWGFAGVGVTQIGLARRVNPGSRQGRVDLAAFLRKTEGRVTPRGAPTSIRAGMIPCGGRLPVVARARALLVGDAAGLVSPATAGGIHAALRYGEEAGEAVARFIAGKVADPAGWLPRQYPRFRIKRVVRAVFEWTQGDWTYNLLLRTRAMRRIGERVYFHSKGTPALRSGAGQG